MANAELLVSEKRVKGLNSIKLAALISFRLLLCPGDDVAMIIAQTLGSTHPEMPPVALIHPETKVETIFEKKKASK